MSTSDRFTRKGFLDNSAVGKSSLIVHGGGLDRDAVCGRGIITHGRGLDGDTVRGKDPIAHGVSFEEDAVSKCRLSTHKRIIRMQTVSILCDFTHELCSYNQSMVQ